MPFVACRGVSRLKELVLNRAARTRKIPHACGQGEGGFQVLKKRLWIVSIKAMMLGEYHAQKPNGNSRT